MAEDHLPIGAHVRRWRAQRRMSQLDLAHEAGISARHLSFVETGRARPSRELVLRLAEMLDAPRREWNVWLLAAGFAPLFPVRGIDDPDLEAAIASVRSILENQKPFPAFAIDGRWNIVLTNGALPELYDDVSPELMRAPVNVMRLALHPQGLAPRTLNFSDWSAHLLARLRRQIHLTGDRALVRLANEVSRYPHVAVEAPAPAAEGVAIALALDTRAGPLRFLSTTMVFGTPLDVTLSELAVECFFPADAATDRRVRDLDAHRAEPVPALRSLGA